MKEVTKKDLKRWNACQDGFDFWVKNCEGKPNIKQIQILAEYRFNWANWILSRILDKKQRIKYAIFSAELVLNIFEKKYPEDTRPRAAIEAAKKVLLKNTKANRDAAYAAAYAAYTAADAAYAAYTAAYAAYAAYTITSAAASAAYTADAADAASAAYTITYAAADACEIKIINYGLALLKGEN
jgi:hypothetical protein